MISSEEIKKFEEKLLKAKEKVEAEIKTLKKPVSFGGDVGDPDDEEADESEEFENNVGQAEALEIYLADVNSALDKIKSGSYGICENCNEPIEPEVLKAAPESRFCKNCKLSV